MALLEEILEDDGFNIKKAPLAEDGIALLNKTAVDLILMDISLPGMSGLEAARLIKADRAVSAIPVIALTAHAMHNDREAAMSAGCDGFLTKPIDEDKLLEMINKHLLKD